MVYKICSRTQTGTGLQTCSNIFSSKNDGDFLQNILMSTGNHKNEGLTAHRYTNRRYRRYQGDQIDKVPYCVRYWQLLKGSLYRYFTTGCLDIEKLLFFWYSRLRGLSDILDKELL
jgi:hypothetical protein